MKIKSLLFLLIILQVVACNKRYANLKKIRLPYETVRVEKRSAEMEQMDPVKADVVTNAINGTGTPSLYHVKEFHYSRKSITHCKQDPLVKIKHKMDFQPEKSKQILTKPGPKQSKDMAGTNALIAFIFTILALVAIPFLFIAPFLVFLAILLLAAGAIDYGKQSYRELQGTKHKRKWMAVLGLAIGTIITSFILVTILIFIPLLFSFGPIDIPEISSIIVFFGTILSSIRLLINFRNYKKKRSEATRPDEHAKPGEPDQERSLQGRNKFATAAIVLLIAAVASIIFVVLVPLIAIITLICFLLAIIFGIIGLKQIKKTHEDGKWLAIIAIFFLPLLFILLSPPLLIVALLVLGIRRLIRRRKRKMQSVSPS